MFTTFFSFFYKDNHHMSLLGIFVFLLVAFLFSNNKGKVNYLRALNALILQFVLAFIVLKTNFGHVAFAALAKGFARLYSFTDAGVQFMFGNMVNVNGPWGFVFAVKVMRKAAQLNKIEKFDNNGNFILMWGIQGTGDGDHQRCPSTGTR